MLITSSALIVLGGIAFLGSALFKTPEAPPFGWFNPKHWKPIWNPVVRTWFNPPGYTLMSGGLALLMVGTLLHWVFVGWPW
jgi:hypothetical protein